MSLPTMTFGDKVCFSRKGRWDSMAVSGLHFGNALVGSEWATAVLLCMNGLRK